MYVHLSNFHIRLTYNFNYAKVRINEKYSELLSSDETDISDARGYKIQTSVFGC